MNATKTVAFLRQPSTVLGLSALIGALTALVTGQLNWQGAVPAVAGALAAILLPDNAGAQTAIKDAAVAVVAAEQAVVAASCISQGTSSLVPEVPAKPVTGPSGMTSGH